MTNGKTCRRIADELWRFLLFSEFVFDLPGRTSRCPGQRAAARPKRRGRWWRICATRSAATRGRRANISSAPRQIEEELNLPEHLPGDRRPRRAGHLSLRGADVPGSAVRGAGARTTRRHPRASSTATRGSVWIGKGESQAQWGLAGSGLQARRRLRRRRPPARRPRPQPRRPDRTTTSSSLRDVDRLQREFEQAVGDYISLDGSMSEAVDHAGGATRSSSRRSSTLFTKHLETTGGRRRAGWPTPTCSTASSRPLLKESGRRVAFIMVDALRYELGVTLHRQLAETEQAEIRAGLRSASDRHACRHGVAAARRRARACGLCKEGDGFA